MTSPRPMRLEEACEYLAEDELLGANLQSGYIRNRILENDERGKQFH